MAGSCGKFQDMENDITTRSYLSKLPSVCKLVRQRNEQAEPSPAFPELSWGEGHRVRKQINEQKMTACDGVTVGRGNFDGAGGGSPFRVTRKVFQSRGVRHRLLNDEEDFSDARCLPTAGGQDISGLPSGVPASVPPGRTRDVRAHSHGLVWVESASDVGCAAKEANRPRQSRGDVPGWRGNGDPGTGQVRVHTDFDQSPSLVLSLGFFICGMGK